MYDVMEFILAGGVFILGLIMAVCPKLCTKKENRDIPDTVKRTRISGIFLCIIGILVIIVFGITFNMSRR